MNNFEELEFEIIINNKLVKKPCIMLSTILKLRKNRYKTLNNKKNKS